MRFWYWFALIYPWVCVAITVACFVGIIMIKRKSRSL